MVELAGHILQTKAAHFDPSKFKDEYENALKALVRRKASGKPIRVAEREEKPDNVVNLMDALKAEPEGQICGEAARTCPGFAPDTGTAGGEEGAPLGGEAPQGGVRVSPPSWLGLTARSASSRSDVRGQARLVRPGMTEFGERAALPSSPFRFDFFAVFFFEAFRFFAASSAPSALRPSPPTGRIAIACLRLFDLPARAAALQRASLALLHRAL